MNFWSEGLGKRDLVMDLDEAALDRAGDAIILTGTIHKPAEWAYKVTMRQEDWKVVLKTATSAEACAYLSRSVSVLKILSMGLWVVKFIVLMSAFRIGSLIGLVRLDAVEAAAPLEGHPAPQLRARRGGVEKRELA